MFLLLPASSTFKPLKLAPALPIGEEVMVGFFFSFLLILSLAMVSTIPDLETLEGRGERGEKILAGPLPQHDFIPLGLANT